MSLSEGENEISVSVCWSIAFGIHCMCVQGHVTVSRFSLDETAGQHEWFVFSSVCASVSQCVCKDT